MILAGMQTMLHTLPDRARKITASQIRRKSIHPTLHAPTVRREVGCDVSSIRCAALYELGVERDLGVVGEELRDGAAGLGIGGGLVKSFL